MKVHKAFRLDEELIQKLQKQADLENRSLSNLIETILFNYLNTEQYGK